MKRIFAIKHKTVLKIHTNAGRQKLIWTLRECWSCSKSKVPRNIIQTSFSGVASGGLFCNRGRVRPCEGTKSIKQQEKKRKREWREQPADTKRAQNENYTCNAKYLSKRGRRSLEYFENEIVIEYLRKKGTRLQGESEIASFQQTTIFINNIRIRPQLASQTQIKLD